MTKEMIGELTGKITGNRVLPMECCPKMESSFHDVGKLLDVEVTNIGTFWTLFKEDGGLYGEGRGIVMSDEGEIVTWTGRGIGEKKGKGAEYIASIFYNTSSEKFKRLNNIMGIAKYSIDEEGNTHEKLWGKEVE
jgi:hypothetical protein